jgi:putative sterol carrier protein
MPTFTTSAEVFDALCHAFRPDKAGSDGALFQFDLSGDMGGRYWLKIENGICSTGAGDAPSEAEVTFTGAGDDFVKMINGELNPIMAMTLGKIKIKGSMGTATKLMSWFDR